MLISLDTSVVKEGRLRELKKAMQELAELVSAKEPRVVFYSVFLNSDETEVTVLQGHPDSASMELHMQIAGSAFPRFKDLLELREIHLYGEVSEQLMDLVRKKAKLLGAQEVKVNALVAETKTGLSRDNRPSGPDQGSDLFM